MGLGARRKLSRSANPFKLHVSKVPNKPADNAQDYSSSDCRLGPIWKSLVCRTLQQQSRTTECCNWTSERVCYTDHWSCLFSPQRARSLRQLLVHRILSEPDWDDRME